MISIQETFESLSIPTNCRNCPKLGELVVEHAATTGNIEVLTNAAVDDDWHELMAAKLASHPNTAMDFDEALTYVNGNAVELRKAFAEEMNMVDKTLSGIEAQVNNLLEGCPGPQIEGAAAQSVFICTSPSQ